MKLRKLGRTGVQVSPLCLGAMMFGAWGNPDHDESVRIIHRALDAGINFIDTADVYSAGESEADRRPGAARAGATTSCWPPSVHGPMGEDPNAQGNSRRWIIAECEDSLRRLGHRLDRPLPDPPARPVLRHRRDPRRPDRPGPSRARSATSAARPSRPTRSSRPSGSPSAAAGSGSSASSRRTRSWSGASRPTCCPPASATAWASSPGARWPAAGCRASTRKGRDIPHVAGSPGIPQRYDLTLPANQVKLDAVEALAALADEAGISLIDLALAFVIQHPAVTAAIIGPRTMEQLEGQLGAADVVLDDDVLDRIDEIVPPGTTLNQADAGWQPAALVAPGAAAAERSGRAAPGPEHGERPVGVGAHRDLRVDDRQDGAVGVDDEGDALHRDEGRRRA